MNKAQPNKSVIKIFCPKCKDLMAKVYPWASFGAIPESQLIPCKKCQNSMPQSRSTQN